MKVKKINNFTQIHLGVVLSYIAIVVNMLVQLCYSPIMIKLLGQSEYGLYTLVGSVVNYLSLFSLGFGGAYLRFYSRYESKKDYKGVARLNGMFLTVFLVMAGIAFGVGLILSSSTEVVFGTNLTEMELEKAGILMRILVVNICLTFPDSVFNAIIIAHEKFVFQKILQILMNLCNPLICMPLLFGGCDAVSIVIVTTGITIIKLCLNIFYCFRFLNVKFIFNGFKFSLLKEIAIFSFFLFLNMIIDQINWSVDKFILGRVAGTTTVAIYGVASTINSLYMNFSTAVSNVFSPRINKIVAEGNDVYKIRLSEDFTRVGRIQFMILGLMVSGFLFFGEYFITDIYLDSSYREVYIITLLLIVPATIPWIQTMGLEIQRAMNMHQFRSLIYFLMAVINVIISIPLAMHFGAVGSAVGTAFSLLIANGLIMNIYYHKAIGINMIQFWISIFQLGRGLVIPLLLGFVIKYISFIDSFGKFIIGILIYTIVYVISFWKLGMNRKEKEMVTSFVYRIRKSRENNR